MARAYAKVSVEMWGDARFGALSQLKPSGQALWLYLLAGRFRTIIPGLSLNVGIGALSDRLGWSQAQVLQAWLEIDAQGMASADWKAGVVWMPKGIKHNEPESPNVVRAWGKVALPECPLTDAALASLRAHLDARPSKAYVKAFDEVFREPFGQPSPNQEQEQEQEQEEPPLPPVNGGRSRRLNRAQLRSLPYDPNSPEAVAAREYRQAMEASQAESRLKADAKLKAVAQ